MPALIPTNITGTVTWLGLVPNRQASLQSDPLQQVTATFSGVAGESHAGPTRASCNRVISQYPLGSEIRNVRQFSILSAEELEKIASALGLETLEQQWLGASMVVSGIPDFSHLPPSSRLQVAGGATLTIDMQNRPCNLPAKVINQYAAGFGKAFKQAAVGLRGVTGWVEQEGKIKVGDQVTLHIPEQRAWKPD